MDTGYLSLFEGSHTPDKPFSFKGGPEVQALEQEWCTFYDCKHAVSLNSATSGLLQLLGLWVLVMVMKQLFPLSR